VFTFTLSHVDRSCRVDCQTAALTAANGKSGNPCAEDDVRTERRLLEDTHRSTGVHHE